MNPIDIEKLKRTSIYSVPPDFFPEMQENVIKAVHQEKRKKKSVFPLTLRWKYSVAAAVVLLFGLSIFFISDQPEESNMAHMKAVTGNSQYGTDSGNRAKKIEEKRSTSVVQEYTTENTSEAKAAHKVAGTGAKFSDVKTLPAHHAEGLGKNNPERNINENIETLLSAYSPSELEEIAGKAAPDVYLDLFD